MVWTKRHNQWYYVKSVRRDGRVTSTWYGRGPLAEAAAALDAQRAEERRARRDAREQAQALDECCRRLAELVTAVHDACLLLTGHHRGRNWIWAPIGGSSIGRSYGMDAGRNLMASKKEKEKALAAAELGVLHALSGAGRQGLDLEAANNLVTLMLRVNRDRPQANDVLEMERVLTENPGIWRLMGDYAEIAMNTMLDQVQATPTERVSFLKGAEELKESLAGAGCSSLETTLAEQIAVCWVRLRIFELWLAKAIGANDADLVEFWDRTVTRAQGRYLDACEALARIRRLAVRAPQLVQINVGGQAVHDALSGRDERVEAAAQRLSEPGEVIEQPAEDASPARKRRRERTAESGGH